MPLRRLSKRERGREGVRERDSELDGNGGRKGERPGKSKGTRERGREKNERERLVLGAEPWTRAPSTLVSDLFLPPRLFFVLIDYV